MSRGELAGCLAVAQRAVRDREVVGDDVDGDHEGFARELLRRSLVLPQPADLTQKTQSGLMASAQSEEDATVLALAQRLDDDLSALDPHDAAGDA